MQRLLGSLVVFGAMAGFALSADVAEDAPGKEGAKVPAKPPAATYQHTTLQGHAGKFELQGERGKADYYFNGEHRKDDLVFSRSAEVTVPPSAGAVTGWVYQVSRDGKKEPLWFFFAQTPVQSGGETYAMSYSTTPPNKDGKQLWTRILTPGGTKRTTAEKKARESDL